MGYKEVATKTITSTDSPYTLEVRYQRIRVDTSAGAVVITLPPVSTLGVGFECEIVHETYLNTLTVNADAADTINDSQAAITSDVKGEVYDLKTVADNMVSMSSNLDVAGGGGGGPQQFRVAFDSDLDTTSPPMLMRGDLSTLNMYHESKLDGNSSDIQARLDSTDTWTDITQGASWDATVANLLAWVNGNVGADVLWEFRLLMVYASGETDETSVLVEYEPA